MKKTRMEKGITLIALIITIVVLLILAVVTIGAVQESDIMSKGKYAAEEYNNAKSDEGSVLLGYQSFIESNLPGGQSSGGNNGGTIGPDGDLNVPGDDVIQGGGMDSVITNNTANSIPNGTYYYLGESSEADYLKIADSGNIIHLYDEDFPATVTVNNGEVTVVFSIDEREYTFKGNYYETIGNNKIITLGIDEFESYSRTGFLFAANTNNLKYDIVGSFRGGKSNSARIVFTEGTNIAVRDYGTSLTWEFAYAGFEDMFYINQYQVKYTGLQDEFTWDENGTYRRES